MRVAGEVKNYNLKPGEAVTYPTGMDHCVRPVTKGVRKALVIWTKSAVTDPLLREITLFQIKNIIISVKKTREKRIPSFEDGIERAQRDPLFLMDKIFNLIGRAETAGSWYKQDGE